MHFSNLITLAAAGLAAAAPSAPKAKTDSFEVSKFVFGCTAGCYYNFDVSFKNDAKYHCEGSLDDNDYVKCTGTKKSETISAYIDDSNSKNVLKLQAEVSNAKEGSRYNYFGHDQVYAATSSDADKQKAKFSVPVSKTTGVA